MQHQKLYSAGYYGEGRLGRKATTNQLGLITKQLPPLLMFSCGWKHNVFLTRDFQVFVCGENGEGQIGPGQSTCIEPTKSEALSKLRPIWVSCGDKITAFLTENKKIYVCGFEWGTNPVELKINSEHDTPKMVFVSCGVENICGISSEGQLYVWDKRLNAPIHYECPGVQFCDVAAGKKQILALSVTGELYACGSSKSCGMGSNFSSKVLKKVSFLDSCVSIKRVFAYSDTSIAITNDGHVYVCGTNVYGELGIPDVAKANHFMPLRVFDNNPVLMATIGDTFSAYLTKKHELYTCGDGDEYRLCNTNIERVTVPKLASATSNMKVMWACAGCSHIIIAENMEDFPVHPGREFFNLEGTLMYRRVKFSTICDMTLINNVNTIVDTTDRGIAWTGFLPDDIVIFEDKKFRVIGTATKGIIGQQEGSNEYVILPFNELKLFERNGLDSFVEETTKSGKTIFIDNSPYAARAFGFAVGDKVRHRLAEFEGTVVGTYAGNLWFKFPFNKGRVTTATDNSTESLHKSLEIIEPKDREILYLTYNDLKIPVETKPCKILEYYDLMIGDLIDSQGSISTIIGTFRNKVVVRDVITQSYKDSSPQSLKLLRRINAPAKRTFRSMKGKHIELDVSCKSDSPVMPFDRVITSKGNGIVAGTNENGLWVRMDEAAALGAGVGFIKDPSSVRVLMRVSQPGVPTVLDDGIDVGTDVLKAQGIIPDDLVIFEGRKARVRGGRSNMAVVEAGDWRKEVDPSALKECPIVYRAVFEAKRLYRTKNGSSANFSVSLRDFVGVRFIPDDVVEVVAGSAVGTGLVVGISGSEVGVHIEGHPGASFVPVTQFKHAQSIKMVERRAIKSIFNSSSCN